MFPCFLIVFCLPWPSPVLWIALLPCLCHFVLLVFDPACYWLCSLLKLHLDPIYVVSFTVTKDFAIPRSSSLTEDYSNMDPAERMLFLRQGSKTIENYTVEFCTLVNSLIWKYNVLNDFYCYGLNKPIKSLLPKGMNVPWNSILTMHFCYVVLPSRWGSRRTLPLNIFFGKGHHTPSSSGHRAWHIIVTSMSSDNGR